MKLRKTILFYFQDTPILKIVFDRSKKCEQSNLIANLPIKDKMSKHLDRCRYRLFLKLGCTDLCLFDNLP